MNKFNKMQYDFILKLIKNPDGLSENQLVKMTKDNLNKSEPWPGEYKFKNKECKDQWMRSEWNQKKFEEYATEDGTFIIAYVHEHMYGAFEGYVNETVDVIGQCEFDLFTRIGSNTYQKWLERYWTTYSSSSRLGQHFYNSFYVQEIHYGDDAWSVLFNSDDLSLSYELIENIIEKYKFDRNNMKAINI